MPDSGIVFAPAQKLTTNDLAALNGGYVEVYEAGTSTPKTVYSDKALTTSLGSTVYLDSTGAPVASSGSSTKVMVYTGAAAVKLIIKTSAGVTLQTIDNLQCAQDTSLFGTGSGSADMDVDAVTSDTTLNSTHNGHLLQCDPTGGTFSLTLTSAITLGNGWTASVRHDGTANQVKIATVSGQSIKLPGGTTTAGFALTAKGQTATIVCDGAGFTVKDYSPPFISSTNVQFNVTSRLAAPPTSPTPGARYIISGTPTGAWSSYAQHDVVEADGQGTWTKYTPPANCGWVAYVTGESLLTQFRSSAWVDLSNITAPEQAYVRKAKWSFTVAANTGGGTASTGAWTDAALNTEDYNRITTTYGAVSDASLATNVITLPTGQYEIDVFFNTRQTGPSRCRFISTTDSAKVLYSDSGTADSAGAEQKQMRVRGPITVTASSEAFKVQYWASAAGTLGTASNLGSISEVHRWVVVTDLAQTQGPQGEQGIQGNAGADGADAGWKYTWSSNTSASDPSSGGIKGNNATLASITALYISETDADANGLASEIATWDDSTSTTAARSKIKIGNSSGMILFQVTGANTDNGTWVTLTGSVVGWRGSLAGTVRVAPALTGDKGDTGAGGATGAAAPAFIDYSLDPSSTADSDPGSGKLRPNNATAASVTTFFFDDLDRLGNNQASELATWDDSTSSGAKGKLYIIDLTTPANRWTYDVTAFTAATGYSKITVTHRSGTAAWPTGNVGVLFVPRGDKGADGSGSGDVVGPASATDSRIAAFDGTTGKLLKDGGKTIAEVEASAAASAVATVRNSVDAAFDTFAEVKTALDGKLAAANNLSDVASTATARINLGLGASDSPQFAGVNLSHASANTLTGSSGDALIEGTILKKVGKETIGVPSGAMTPRTTNGAARGTVELTTNDVMLYTLDFDTTTEEGAGFWVPMPKSYNNSTVTFQAAWTAASGSGGVAWGLAAYAFSDDDAMDTAVSGQQVVTDTLITANDLHITSESSAITIGGTPATGDWLYFEITREVANGSDTLAADARLLGIRLFFTSNASTDA